SAYLFTDLAKCLGTFVAVLGHPARCSQVDHILEISVSIIVSLIISQINRVLTYHEHELESAGQARCLNHHVDADKVCVHHRVTLLRRIQAGTNSAEQARQTLHLGFVRNALVVDQLLDTFVHDTLRQHAQLVQFTNELDQTQTTTLGSGSGVILVRHHGRFFRRALGLGRKVHLPAAFELLLATVEQVLAEQAATRNHVAVLVTNALVPDFRAYALKHTLAELGVHGSPVRFVRRFLERELDDLPQGPPVGLILGLGNDVEDLLRDTVEVIRRHLVEVGLNFALHHFWGETITARSRTGGSLADTARLPASGRDCQWLNVLVGSERHRLVALLFLLLSLFISTLAALPGASAAARRTGRLRRVGMQGS
ncbi:hypothetical protein T310_9151, partial [Rasamsonia emersonii CBS 393.64]